MTTEKDPPLEPKKSSGRRPRNLLGAKMHEIWERGEDNVEGADIEKILAVQKGRPIVPLFGEEPVPPPLTELKPDEEESTSVFLLQSPKEKAFRPSGMPEFAELPEVIELPGKKVFPEILEISEEEEIRALLNPPTFREKLRGGFRGFKDKVKDYIKRRDFKKLSAQEFAVGFGSSALTKAALRILLSSIGLSSFGLSIAVGAGGGAALGGFKEYRRQRAEIGVDKSYNISQKLRAELDALKEMDLTKLGVAAGFGAAFGGAGAVGGAFAMSFILESDLAKNIGSEIWTKIIHPMIEAPSHTPIGTVIATVRPTTQTAIPTEAPSATAIPSVTPTAEPSHIISNAQPTTTPEAPPTPHAPTPSATPSIQTPTLPETIKIPEGSAPWTEFNHYITAGVGHPVPPPEITHIVDQALAHSQISDPTNVSPGTEIDATAANQYIKESLASKLAPVDRLSFIPDKAPLPDNTTIWSQTEHYLSVIKGGKPPDEELVKRVTREICRLSDVSSPELGVIGHISENSIGPNVSINWAPLHNLDLLNAA